MTFIFRVGKTSCEFPKPYSISCQETPAEFEAMAPSSTFSTIASANRGRHRTDSLNRASKEIHDDSEIRIDKIKKLKPIQLLAEKVTEKILTDSEKILTHPKREQKTDIHKREQRPENKKEVLREQQQPENKKELSILLFGWGKVCAACVAALFEFLPEHASMSLRIISHTKQDEDNRLDLCLESVLKKKYGSEKYGSVGKNFISKKSVSPILSSSATGNDVKSTQCLNEHDNEANVNEANVNENEASYDDETSISSMFFEEICSNRPPSSNHNHRMNNEIEKQSTTSSNKNDSKNNSQQFSCHLFPDHIKPDDHAIVQGYKPDLIVSVYYRKRLSRKVLDLPKIAAINFHPSLLPRHRGCFSGFWTIFDGDGEAGTTCHHMLEKFDAGKIIRVEKLNLDQREDSKTLQDKVEPVTVECFRQVLSDFLLSGEIPEGYSQGAAGCSHHPRKLPFNGVIQHKEWDDAKIERFIRAMRFPGFEGAVYISDESGKRYVCDSMDDYWKARNDDTRRSNEGKEERVGKDLDDEELVAKKKKAEELVTKSSSVL